MTQQAGLTLSALAFLATHFAMSHPLRAPLVRAVGERGFQAVYSLVAIVTFGAAIYFYRAIGREPMLWQVGEAGAVTASLLMWFGSILFVGSFIRNPALPGASIDQHPAPKGVFAITRHPMMWGFALWAITHLMVVATAKALVLDGAILFMALAGAAGQDRKKGGQLGDRWHEWTGRTSFVPFGRGLASPGAVATIGGTLFFFAATWLHPMPAGLWRILA